MVNVKNIYFLGIGGIGMSALARYFMLQGASVSGYDRTPSPLTAELESEGIKIHYSEDIDQVPDEIDLVVYTPAIPRIHAEFVYFSENGFRMKKRSEVLGIITEGKKTIAVSGTHGKTTVSTMIAHILKSSGVNVTAFLGGISKNYGTNFIAGDSIKDDHVFVVEADEFDRSFLTLYPDIAVITSTDADHLDIYGNKDSVKSSFKEFSSHIKKDGHLVVKNSIGFIPENKNGYKVHLYGISGNGLTAGNIRNEDGKYLFDLSEEGSAVIENISPGLPGLFNIENSVAASAVAALCGIDNESVRKAVGTYEGVVRRFDFRIRRDDLIYLDDYAHHPAEITACLDSVKKMYPGKKITLIFQPHLYSRTRDFADEFAVSLSMADTLILLDIYPARELPVPGVTSELLFEKCTVPDRMICSKEDLIKVLKEKNPELIITMGAGDIDRMVEPITEAFGK